MAKDKEAIKGRILHFDEATPSLTKDKNLERQEQPLMAQPKSNNFMVKIIDQLMQKWMHLQASMLKEMFEDVSGKMTTIGKYLWKLEWETGAMTINIVGSKFDVHIDLLGTNLKKFASTVKTQTWGRQVQLLSTQLVGQGPLSTASIVGKKKVGIANKPIVNQS